MVCIFKIHLYLCIHSADVYLFYHILGSVFKKKKLLDFCANFHSFCMLLSIQFQKTFLVNLFFFCCCCRWHCLLCISIKKAVTKCQLPHLIKVKVQFCDSWLTCSYEKRLKFHAVWLHVQLWAETQAAAPSRVSLLFPDDEGLCAPPTPTTGTTQVITTILNKALSSEFFLDCIYTFKFLVQPVFWGIFYVPETVLVILSDDILCNL